MSEHFYIAIDLGAESTRVMIGRLEAERLELREAHRFPTNIEYRGTGIFWNLRRLEEQIVQALQEISRGGVFISSISADSWGVDYVLIDPEGQALDEPRCYRDPRNQESKARLLKQTTAEKLYAETGIPPDVINTIFQLEAEGHENPGLLANAHRLLFIADYINFRLSGQAVAEISLASTSQLFDPQSGDWSPEMVKLINLKASLLPKIIPTATVLGPPTPSVHENGSLALSKIIATCSHDTSAAIAAIPAKSGDSWAYLSSGTWSIVGAPLSSPLLTPQALAGGFTHEMGFNGSFLLCKNIVGLWILQQCAKHWRQTGLAFNYGQLARLAEEAGGASSHINVADPRFLSPGNMPEKIADYCRESGQREPQSPGECVRIILESLALFYERTLSQLREVTGRNYQILHIVGGGSRNELLNQLTASAARIDVVAGPMEATAAGNMLIQAKALGHVEHPEQFRPIIANSFPIHRYKAAHHFTDKARERFASFFPAPTT